MANRRFEMYEYRQVLVRMRSGDSDRQIARRGLMGRRKAGELRQLARAKGWLGKGRALPDEPTLACHVERRRARTTQSQVERFREEVTKWWRQGIQGTTIHEALRRKFGFEGSYSSVRRFLRRLSAGERRATVILDFDPGECAQVDFGRGPKLPAPGGGTLWTWVFVMTLAWSRHQYAEVVLDQKVETWLSCHRHAFEFFNGVVRSVRVDNAKCAITRACSRDPEVQRAYAELAEGYGFTIDPCPPRDPKKKGRVEAGVKYLKRNFLPLRDFRDLTDANRQLLEWVLGPAGNRLHGTTHERPLRRFSETERVLLQPLPAIAPEPAAWAKVKVHRDGHVRFEKGRYSVPYSLIEKSLWLRATPSAVHLFEDYRLVAVHPRLRRAGERSTLDDHLPPEALAFKRQNAPWCRERSEQIGPSCHELIGELLGRDRLVDQLRAAQSVLRLARSYGSTRLEAACQRALAFGDTRYRTVKTILEKGLDHLPDDTSEGGFQLAPAYTGGRFTRHLSTLLTDPEVAR